MKYKSVSIAEAMTTYFEKEEPIYIIMEVSDDYDLKTISKAFDIVVDTDELDLVDDLPEEPIEIETPETWAEATETIAKEIKKKKPAVDVGKMQALYKAGWSVTKIADELRCSTQTVYNHIKKGDM